MEGGEAKKPSTNLGKSFLNKYKSDQSGKGFFRKTSDVADEIRQIEGDHQKQYQRGP